MILSHVAVCLGGRSAEKVIYGNISNGASDDLASTVILASDKDIFLTPAMNVRMWEHPSTKENLNKLKSFGYKIIGPEVGDMACGEYGEGKMTEPKEIISKSNPCSTRLDKLLTPQSVTCSGGYVKQTSKGLTPNFSLAHNACLVLSFPPLIGSKQS